MFAAAADEASEQNSAYRAAPAFFSLKQHLAGADRGGAAQLLPNLHRNGRWAGVEIDAQRREILRREQLGAKAEPIDPVEISIYDSLLEGVIEEVCA